MSKEKKSWYKRLWAIVLWVLIGLWILGNFIPDEQSAYEVSEDTSTLQQPTESATSSTDENKEEVVCVEKWSCTEWKPEECPASEIQTRTCTDSNNCDTNKNKPSEKRFCTFVEEIIEMTTTQIFKEFSGLTDLQVEEKIKEYKGKRIKTSIYVDKVDKASLSTQYVAMEMYEYPYNLIPYVKAFFPADEKNKLLKAGVGDTLVFSGEFVTFNKGSLTDGYIEFTKSRVIEIK